MNDSEYPDAFNDEDLMEQGDITITPCGPLGSMYSVGEVEGKHIGEYSTDEEVKIAIYEYMEKNQFWPSLWFISDHGNVSSYSLED